MAIFNPPSLVDGSLSEILKTENVVRMIVGALILLIMATFIVFLGSPLISLVF